MSPLFYITELNRALGKPASQSSTSQSFQAHLAVTGLPHLTNKTPYFYIAITSIYFKRELVLYKVQSCFINGVKALCILFSSIVVFPRVASDPGMVASSGASGNKTVADGASGNKTVVDVGMMGTIRNNVIYFYIAGAVVATTIVVAVVIAIIRGLKGKKPKEGEHSLFKTFMGHYKTTISEDGLDSYCH